MFGTSPTMTMFVEDQPLKYVLAGCSAVLASPALAHPGDHAGLDLMALAGHFFEPDHIIFATLAAIIGVLAYRAGVRKGRQS